MKTPVMDQDFDVLVFNPKLFRIYKYYTKYGYDFCQTVSTDEFESGSVALTQNEFDEYFRKI